MTITYADAWPIYQALGWPGSIPLQAGTKWPPPTGWTGWDGRYPSGADCAEWVEHPTYRGTTQLAQRLASTVIGIDVDAYDGKTGGKTIAEAERRWGTLPSGPWSSARDDGVSGIRLYTVPDGTALVSLVAFRDLGIGHIEVIQRHHRFAVVWPSIHPDTGRPYTWRGTAGPDQPPAMADLPALPDTWLAALAGTGDKAERARPEEAQAFLMSLPNGDPCPAVQNALQAAKDGLRTAVAARHDDVRDHVLRLMRLGEQGHPGTVATLSDLQREFCNVVTADGSRSYAAACGEFDRMVEGRRGIGLLLATPTPPERRGCRCSGEQGPPTRAAIVGMLRAVLNASDEDRPRMLKWATRKLHRYATTGHLDEVYVRNVTSQLTEMAGDR